MRMLGVMRAAKVIGINGKNYVDGGPFRSQVKEAELGHNYPKVAKEEPI